MEAAAANAITGPSSAISVTRGKVGRQQRDSASLKHPRQAESREAAGDPEREALEKQLADEATARRADRRANGELAASRRGPHELQAGDIRGGDPEQAQDRGEEHDQRPAHVGRERLGERSRRICTAPSPPKIAIVVMPVSAAKRPRAVPSAAACSTVAPGRSRPIASNMAILLPAGSGRGTGPRR
jgi:hypothetical protein